MQMQLVDQLFVGESPVVARAKLELAQEINSSTRVLHKFVSLCVKPKPGWMPRFVWKRLLGLLVVEVDPFEKVRL